ncbi:hypothetical protein AAG906_025190 [Vitis piasezkii]
MGLLDLFVAALVPVLKVLLLTAVGSLLAIDRIGILGEDARKHLNSVSLFCNLNYFFQLYMYCFRIIIGEKTTRAPQELRGLVLGCCAAAYGKTPGTPQERKSGGTDSYDALWFTLDQSSKLYYLGLILTGNLGNLLLIIIPAVCREKGSPFGAVDICCRHGLTYASPSMAIGAIYLWSYVYNIMWIYSIKTNVGANMSDSTISRMSSGENPYGISKCSQGPLLPSNGCLFTEASSYQPELPCMIPEGNVILCLNTIFPGTGLCLVSILDKIKQCLKMNGLKIDMRMLFAPSTTGAVC